MVIIRGMVRGRVMVSVRVRVRVKGMVRDKAMVKVRGRVIIRVKVRGMIFNFNSWWDERCFESCQLEVVDNVPVRLPETHRVHFSSFLYPIELKHGESVEAEFGSPPPKIWRDWEDFENSRKESREV